MTITTTAETIDAAARIGRLTEFATDVAHLADQRLDFDLRRLGRRSVPRPQRPRGGAMTRDELTDRVIELFPPLAEVKPWEWARPRRASRWWWSSATRASPASTAAPWT